MREGEATWSSQQPTLGIRDVNQMYPKFYHGKIGRKCLYSSFVQAQEILEINPVHTDSCQRENHNTGFLNTSDFGLAPGIWAIFQVALVV